MAKVTMIKAVTLKVSSMARSLSFYRDALGFQLTYGSERSSFSSLKAGDSYLNLELSEGVAGGWGMVIFYCDDVDAFHSRLKTEGFNPSPPRDASWGERFFHMTDPDGHELSFAQPMQKRT